MSYARVSILGAVNGGEVWSINPVFDPTGEFPGWNQAQADAATLAIDAITIPSSLLALMTTAFQITGCRLEVRNDSTDLLIGTSVHTKSTPTAGIGSPVMPAQAALVCSVRTDSPGASGRGRIYWPAVGATVNTTFRLSSPTPATIVADFKTYLTAVQGALAGAFTGIGFNLAVRSTKTHTTPHATRLQVGNIIDTQRRRRDRFAESYSAVAFP